MSDDNLQNSTGGETQIELSDATPTVSDTEEPAATELTVAKTIEPEQIDREQTEPDPLPPPLRADSTLQSAVDAFGEYMLRKGFSDNTIKAFRNDLKILLHFMGEETTLHQIKTDHLEDFLDWLQHDRGKPCSPKTLARRITTLKVLFGWLHGISIIGSDPAEPIVHQPVRTPLPNILSNDEIARLVRTARDRFWDIKKTDSRPYFLISLLLQTGIKKAECARLAVSDLSVVQSQALQVQIRYDDPRHAHKNRTLSVSPDIIPVFEKYLEQYKPENLLFECTPRNLEYVLTEIGQETLYMNKRVGFETLRWTCLIRDYRTGMPEEQLRDKMGLSKISWRGTREKILQLINSRL